MRAPTGEADDLRESMGGKPAVASPFGDAPIQCSGAQQNLVTGIINIYRYEDDFRCEWEPSTAWSQTQIHLQFRNHQVLR